MVALLNMAVTPDNIAAIQMATQPTSAVMEQKPRNQNKKAMP
jgi:hypothetical protein